MKGPCWEASNFACAWRQTWMYREAFCCFLLALRVLCTVTSIFIVIACKSFPASTADSFAAKLWMELAYCKNFYLIVSLTTVLTWLAVHDKRSKLSAPRSRDWEFELQSLNGSDGSISSSRAWKIPSLCCVRPNHVSAVLKLSMRKKTYRSLEAQGTVSSHTS